MTFAGLASNPCPERDIGFGIIFLPHHRRSKCGLGVRQKGTFLVRHESRPAASEKLGCGAAAASLALESQHGCRADVSPS